MYVDDRHLMTAWLLIVMHIDHSSRRVSSRQNASACCCCCLDCIAYYL